MELSAGDLNRTLLHRQHLLDRVDLPLADAVRHLVGLQAQENLSPFLGLAARLRAFDPYDVTRGLEDRWLVRMVCLRGTIHLLTPEDALGLRPFTRPAQERERKSSVNTRPALHLDREEFAGAVGAVLADGPLPFTELGEALAGHFPDVPAGALAHLARVDTPLVQLPPRGMWRGAGGVVLQRVDRWLGQPEEPADPAGLVRRYLRAFGPATAADVTTWSGATGIAAVLKGMAELVTHVGPGGRTLFDVPDGQIVPGEAPAPARLLGTYDNLWLSHAARDRVTTPEARKAWMGSNGGLACTVFVDGMLTGLWRHGPEGISVEAFRRLTRGEQRDLDDEVGRVEALLAR